MKKYLTSGLTGVVALTAGLAIGGATVEPEIVTKTKEVEVIKEVKTVPPACSEALDLAEQGFEAYSAGFRTTADIIQGVIDFDNAAIEAGNAKLDRIKSEELDPTLLEYYLAADSCRSF